MEQESGRHTSIVALTAHAMEGDGRNIMAVGLDYYLTKPLNKAMLIAQIEAAFTDEMVPIYPRQDAG
jgi:CheY-like chemotaxis protein